MQTAKRFGIAEDRAVNYHADCKGTRVVYETLSKAVCSVRNSAPMGADWAADINADYESRR